MSTTRNAQKARRHLATITPSQVDAMTSADPDALREVVALVVTMATDSDVAEHAAILAASFMPGAQSTRHAARAAVAAARRAVALSTSLADTAVMPDDVEEVETLVSRADARSTMARYAPDPAASYSIGYGDLLETIVAQHGRSDAMRELLAAYLRHARTCETCGAADSHRVTLRGVAQHLAGITTADAEYHAMRRLADTLLRGALSTFSALASTIGDPSPMAPAHVSHARVSLGDCAPVTTRTYLAPVRTITTPEGVRAMTDAEVAALTSPAPDREARHAGEEYGVSSAPNRRDLRADGTLPTFAVAPSPRKKAGTGSTGPTVRAF